jgi:hypothetical protein
MLPSETFGSWLLRQQHRDDPIGDLAKDFIQDFRWNEFDPHLIIYPSHLYSRLLATQSDAWGIAYQAGREFMQYRWLYRQNKKGLVALSCRGVNLGKAGIYENARAIWGVWYLNIEQLTLQHIRGLYEIDLEGIDSTATMLDWIFQLSHKSARLYGKTVVKDLIDAFDDIFRPQKNCCSFGAEKKFVGAELARQFVDERQSLMGNAK